MKKPNSLHGRVASSASDNTRRQHRFQVSSRGLLACGCSIRHSVFDKSSLTHHLLLSGKKMRFSCMAQAMLAFQQVISRDYHLLPRMILARIRPGESLSRVYGIWHTLELNRHEKRSGKKDCGIFSCHDFNRVAWSHILCATGKDTPRALSNNK